MGRLIESRWRHREQINDRSDSPQGGLNRTRLTALLLNKKPFPVKRRGFFVGHRSLVIGHWSLVIGHWSLVIGHWSLVIGHWSLVIGHWSLVIGHWFHFMNFLTTAPINATAITVVATCNCYF